MWQRTYVNWKPSKRMESPHWLALTDACYNSLRFQAIKLLVWLQYLGHVGLQVAPLSR